MKYVPFLRPLVDERSDEQSRSSGHTRRTLKFHTFCRISTDSNQYQDLHKYVKLSVTDLIPGVIYCGVIDLVVECHNRKLWVTFATLLAKRVTCPQLHCFHKIENEELPRIALLRYHATNLSLSASFSHFLALLSRSVPPSLSLSLARAPSVFVSLFLLLSCSFCQTHFMFPPSLFVCFLFLSKCHSLFFLFPSVTYFPLLSFCSSFTLPIVY